GDTSRPSAPTHRSRAPCRGTLGSVDCQSQEDARPGCRLGPGPAGSVTRPRRDVVMVRVRVPHVRPIVCCTVKRAVRLLPSALLLVFVLSLILVTLVQIAVIHSHRRALYLQRRVATTSRPSATGAAAGSLSAWSSSAGQPVPGQGDGSPTSHFQAWSAAHKSREARRRQQPPPPHASHNKSVKVRPNALQVEALLDKNAPSVENNIKILTGLANAARIRDIFGVLTAAGNVSSSAGGARQVTSVTTTTAAASSNGSSWELVTDVYDGSVLWGDPRRTRKLGMASVRPTTRPLCPEVPPGLAVLSWLNSVAQQTDVCENVRLIYTFASGDRLNLKPRAKCWSAPEHVPQSKELVIVVFPAVHRKVKESSLVEVRNSLPYLHPNFGTTYRRPQPSSNLALELRSRIIPKPTMSTSAPPTHTTSSLLVGLPPHGCTRFYLNADGPESSCASTSGSLVASGAFLASYSPFDANHLLAFPST
ncbi:hypothetical protein HPB47_020301, partial [Ixodes persulcatus]